MIIISGMTSTYRIGRWSRREPLRFICAILILILALPRLISMRKKKAISALSMRKDVAVKEPIVAFSIESRSLKI